MNAYAQAETGKGLNRPGKIASWAMSWFPPLLIGLIYFAAYYPGFTNHDSQSIWLNAFQYVGDPATIPIMDWYTPWLSLLRVLALQTGLGVTGYHALFCLLSYGTWAVLVAALIHRPWQRLCTHGLLLLPFIGANLAFQASDIWASMGLAWMIIALRLGQTTEKNQHTWSVPVLYFFGSLILLGARQNALLVLPVFMAVPWLFRCHVSPSVRYACVAAPLAALIAIQAAVSILPLRQDHKTEIYMAFETIGVWKSVVASHTDAELEAMEPPLIFAMLPQPPGYYLFRWNPSNVDAIIWDLPEFANRSNFDGSAAGIIRKDFFRTVFRYPLNYARVKLSFTRNGLGLSPPDALPVSSVPPSSWIDQLGIPLYHRPLAAGFTQELLNFNSRSLATWLPLSAPLAWWVVAIVVFFWRKAQGRVTRLDGAWITLIAAYYLTILLFAPIYLPRYVFPVWVVLGVGIMRLLLNPEAGNRKLVDETSSPADH